MRKRGGGRNVGIALGVLAAALGFGSLPLYFHNRHQKLNKPLVRSDQPLTGTQIMRGPYVNSGSKDAGRDPDWDLDTGRYKGHSPLDLIQSPYERSGTQKGGLQVAAAQAAAAATAPGASTDA